MLMYTVLTADLNFNLLLRNHTHPPYNNLLLILSQPSRVHTPHASCVLFPFTPISCIHTPACVYFINIWSAVWGVVNMLF